MLQQVSPHDIIFIDIETVSEAPDFDKLLPHWQKNWEDKIKYILPEDKTPAEFYPQRAAVMAEFSKIVCISLGYILKEENLKLRVKSFYDKNEKDLLENFLKTMSRIENNSRSWHFGGHNIKEFDIPFICRRLLANGIQIPSFLDFQSMKPWETNILDSFQYWKFGDHKNYTSLNLLSAVLDIPSPKTDMDGSMVGEVYWKQNDLERIVRYCSQDVLTVANVFLHFHSLPIIPESDVEYVDATLSTDDSNI